MNSDFNKIKTFVDVTESLIEVIDDLVELPDCDTCGSELDVLDENNQELEEPFWYCRECEEIVEKEICSEE